MTHGLDLDVQELPPLAQCATISWSPSDIAGFAMNLAGCAAGKRRTRCQYLPSSIYTEALRLVFAIV